MKLPNFFKKESPKIINSKKTNAQTLDKKQLEKVIGGADVVGYRDSDHGVTSK